MYKVAMRKTSRSSERISSSEKLSQHQILLYRYSKTQKGYRQCMPKSDVLLSPNVKVLPACSKHAVEYSKGLTLGPGVI